MNLLCRIGLHRQKYGGMAGGQYGFRLRVVKCCTRCRRWSRKTRRERFELNEMLDR